MFNKSNNNTAQKGAQKSAKPATKAPAQSRVPSGNLPSILSADIIITGDIKTEGEVQIDGRLDGNIVAKGVVIGEKGSVNGKISSNKLTVRGKVTGKIDASTVELLETANVQADIIQDHLSIANGAFFDGKCSKKSGAAAVKPKS